LENARKEIEEFEKEYQRDIEEINQQEREKGCHKLHLVISPPILR